MRSVNEDGVRFVLEVRGPGVKGGTEKAMAAMDLGRKRKQQQSYRTNSRRRQ